MSLALSTAVVTVHAQEQDAKLVDRLLRPNMALVNSAQDKQFSAAGTLAAKKIPTRKFSVRERPAGKAVASRSISSPGQLATPSHGAQDQVANISKRPPANTDMVFVASAPHTSRVARETGRSLTTAPFHGNRQFSGQGKSQKALSARDTPLTIEQVRELLNKNK